MIFPEDYPRNMNNLMNLHFSDEGGGIRKVNTIPIPSKSIPHQIKSSFKVIKTSLSELKYLLSIYWTSGVTHL